MTEHRITLLTRDDCSMCENAKAVLADLGRDFELDVEEIAIDSPAGRELAVSAGVLFPPGVLVDGTPFSHGRLPARKLRRTLSRTTDGSP
ncbi:MAG: glutaredoxin family protein [Actinobacteria bacterium]|nr:glutaredoxin family protein [Actinomycetota bacterium]